MNKKFNKKSLAALALVGCLAATGMSAYFTDTETQGANAQAGNINLTWVDHANNLSGAQEDTTWKTDFDADKVMNPGDSYDFSYTVANTGTKSIDVKQEIVLVSSVALTADAEEYKLTITGGNDTVAVTPTKSADGKTLTYNLTDIILDGSIETEEGSKTTTTDYTVELDFDLAAKNAFMDSTVTLTYNAWAKQHRNAPDANWEAVASYEAIQ